MSLGCVATQFSDQPKIAWPRLMPSSALHPECGSRLLQGTDGIIKVGTTRALVQIAAHRCHIADLARGAGEDRLREKRIAPANQRMIGDIRVSNDGADRDVGFSRRDYRLP